MRRLAFALTCLVAFAASGTSLRNYQPDDPIENPRTCSENGRFCLVQRKHPSIGDFATIRFADLQSDDAADGDLLVALYEIEGDTRTLKSTFEIPWRFSVQTLVADSGQFIAAFTFPSFSDTWSSGDPTLAIYRADGAMVRMFTAGDLFTERDLESIRLSHLAVRVHLGVDDELEREIVFVGLPATIGWSRVETPFGFVRIDAATGSVLDPKRDIYPPLRVWAAHSEGIAARRWTWKDESCSAHSDAARIASKQLVARAVARVTPEFPEIGKKARIAGDVWAEVVVSESGEVVGTCLQGLPFGFDKAVDDAVRRWKFEPYVIDGKPVRVWSEIVFHFNRVEHAEWEGIAASPLQSAPP